MMECEQSGVKQETAPTTVKAETGEEESASSSVPRGASAAGNEEPSGEQHVDRQQSDHREATVSVASVKEEDNEEELNVEEDSSAGGNDDLVQPTNDGTGDDGCGSPVLAETTTAVPTSEVVAGKKRLREAVSSTRNARLQTSSKKRAKLPHSTVHETSEVSGTTAQPRVVRRSARRTTTKDREGTFEGAIMGIGAEEADDNCMPSREEDGSPLDDGDSDHDEDGENSIVPKRAQQGRSAIKSFDERFKALMDFKHKFGHCNTPQTKSGEYMLLGKWCNRLRVSYKKIQKGGTGTLTIKLTEERIRQLEDAGFKWSVSTSRTFDERYAELMKYKEKCGHCNVRQTKSGGYQSLGMWCGNLRTSYKKIQKGGTPTIKLTEEMIRQLEDAGFKWSVSTSRTFDERYVELMKYKEKVGHCNPPQTKSGEYQSLRKWCNRLRTSYRKIQKGGTPTINLTEERIRQLEDAGFKWSLF